MARLYAHPAWHVIPACNVIPRASPILRAINPLVSPVSSYPLLRTGCLSGRGVRCRCLSVLAVCLLGLQFVGEEDCAVSGTPELTDAPTWMVDPLDGTTNFVHG